jgi:hypothetical protein
MVSPQYYTFVIRLLVHALLLASFSYVDSSPLISEVSCKDVGKQIWYLGIIHADILKPNYCIVHGLLIILNLSSTIMEDQKVHTVLQLSSLFLKSLIIALDNSNILLVIISYVNFVCWIAELRGIDCQSEVGFLALLEHLRYCEVGSFLKNPKHPVWVMGSETHLTGIWVMHLYCMC